MSGYRGVLQILRFHWPTYMAALLANGLAAAAVAADWLEPSRQPLALVLLALADGWLLASLSVSHAIYDRSAVARGEWLDADPRPTPVVAVFHFGHDEASAAVARRLGSVGPPPRGGWPGRARGPVFRHRPSRCRLSSRHWFPLRSNDSSILAQSAR